MDYSNSEVKPIGLNQTSGVAPSGHVLHKSEDPIRSVGSSDFNAASVGGSAGGHVLHKSSDPIRPVDSSFSQPIGSDLSANRSNDSSFSLPVGASSRPIDSSSYSSQPAMGDFGSSSSRPLDSSSYSSQPAMSDFSSSTSRPIDSSYSSQPVMGDFSSSSSRPLDSSYSSQPVLGSSSYSSQPIASDFGGSGFKGGDIVQKTDDIQQDVRQAGITNVEPAVQDTRDAAQNLMWELEREKQRKADLLLQEQELERERRLREVPTEQAIEKTDQVIHRANAIRKEAKSEGLKNAVPAAEETRDAAKELKKELENERKNLEPHKEGFLDRAKEWFAGDRDKSSDMSDYDAERKHHDAVVKDINKRDTVGEEKEGILDRAKGWFSKDKDNKDDTKPVVPEYQEARMNHPDLVVKHHDDIVDDINKRDRVGEEGLIQKVKHLFKGSSSAESDNSKPVVAAPTHPVHDFQENPTATGNLPASNKTRFPINTQTVVLPEQRFNLPTAAESDMMSSNTGISNNSNLNNNNNSLLGSNLGSNLNNDSSSTWSSSSQFGSTSGSSNVNSDINSASTFNPTTHFPISNNEAPATSYASAPSAAYPFGSSESSSTQPSTSQSSSITSSNPFLSSSASSNQQQQLPQQQFSQQQQQPLQQSSSSYDMGNSSIDNSSLFNPSTSSLSSTGPNAQGPLNTRLDSGIQTTHAQLHHPSGTRQADV